MGPIMRYRRGCIRGPITKMIGVDRRRSHPQYKGGLAASQEEPVPQYSTRTEGSPWRHPVRPRASDAPRGPAPARPFRARPRLARRLRCTSSTRASPRALTAPEDYPKMTALSPETPKTRPPKESKPMITDPKEKSRTVDLAIAQIEKQFG